MLELWRTEVQYAFFLEEVALAEAIGVGIAKYPKKNFLSRTSILGPEYMGDDCIVPFDEQWETGYRTGPFSIQDRYVTEDVPSMITLGSVMTGKDFYKTGITLDDLGIGHLDKESLLEYLNKGIYKENA